MNYAKDAQEWGSALNCAGWAFLDNCPEKSVLLFNTVKPALREAILVYLERVEERHPCADNENKRLKEQLDGAVEINKQYEQQLKQCRDDLFNLRMENARLDLAAQRWQMFDCEANRNIADKLLKKLADEQGE